MTTPLNIELVLIFGGMKSLDSRTTFHSALCNYRMKDSQLMFSRIHRTVIWKKGAVIIPNQFEITNWPAPLPNRIKKPAYYISSDDVHPICGKAEIQKPSVIAAMRKTCRLAADILRKCPQILQVMR